MPTIDATAAGTAARTLLENHMTPIRDLAAAYTETERLRAALAEAGKHFSKAYTAVENLGWTPEELRKLGFTAPSRPRCQPKSTTPKPANRGRRLPRTPMPPSPYSGLTRQQRRHHGDAGVLGGQRSRLCSRMDAQA
jgi:hypothetical protein